MPATVLRAAVVLGSGSASFEMLRYLTERLPLMITPSWVNTRMQPVAVRDVLAYLVGSAAMPAEVNRTFDIGGPDILTYRELMQHYAAVAKLPRRVILPVPVLTPRLSSHWVGLVTPVPVAIARPLAESLRHEVVCREHDIAAYVPDTPSGRSASTRRSNWRSAASRTPRSPPAGPPPPSPAPPATRCPRTPNGPAAASTRTAANASSTPPPKPCGASSRASAGNTAGTPSRSPGPCAAAWTGWSAGWACGAGGATPST